MERRISCRHVDRKKLQEAIQGVEDEGKSPFVVLRLAIEELSHEVEEVQTVVKNAELGNGQRKRGEGSGDCQGIE
jgi:hypothetical protein